MLMSKPYTPIKSRSSNRVPTANAHDTSTNSLQPIPYAHQRLQTESEESFMPKKSLADAKKEYLDDMLKVGYQPARYHRACEYRDRRSYKKKAPGGEYVPIPLLRKHLAYTATQESCGCLDWGPTSTYSSCGA